MKKLTTEELEQIQQPVDQLTPEEQDKLVSEIRRRIKRDKNNPFHFSGWEGDTFVQKLVVNEDTVRQYLQDCISTWRNSSKSYAIYYVDAFQDAYSAIFGGAYPIEKQDEETNHGSPSP